MGTITVPLDLAVSKVLSQFVPKLKTDFFLATKTGTQLSQAALSKLILRITKDTVGTAVGVRLGRVLTASSSKNRAVIEEANRLANEMGHSRKMQATYIKK